jgi:hypothetical protein
MALERLQARAAAGVPDLDGAIVRRRRQPGRVVREGHRLDDIAMALECLQTRAPGIVHSWYDCHIIWVFIWSIPACPLQSAHLAYSWLTAPKYYQRSQRPALASVMCNQASLSNAKTCQESLRHSWRCLRGRGPSAACDNGNTA